MARSHDWGPLGYFVDPVPGEPSVLTSGGSEYTSVAEAIGRAAFNLRAIAKTDGMISEAVDALVEQADEVATRIERAQERYAGVGAALTEYASPLATAQSWSLEALTSATAAHSAVTESNEVIDRYRFELLNPLLDEESREKYQRLTDEASDEASGGHASVQAAMELLQRAIDLRDSAAATASDSISEVESTGDLNDGFWENVDQFFEEHGEWINNALMYAGIAASILAGIALFVPGLNLIVLAVGITLAVLTVVNSLGSAATGNMSWTEAIINTALAILPFGVGKLASGGIAATRAATGTAAVTSFTSSASGAGVSGITRAVVSSQVDDYVVRAGVNRIAGLTTISDDLINLREIRAITQLRLTSGATSGFIANAAKPATGYMALWASAEFLGPVIEPIVKLPFQGLYDKTVTPIVPVHPKW